MAVLSLALPGCVAAGGGDPGALGQPIIGGVVDPNDPAVVMVMAEDGRGGMSICTGEVISPHVVLTAAHCVDPASVGQGMSFRLFLGGDYNDARQAGNNANYVAVRSTAFDPKFDVKHLERGHDVAVVVTRSAIPVAPLPFAHGPLVANDRGAPLRLVGYGITSGNDQQGASAGTRRQTTSSLTSYDSLFVQLGDPRHNTCEGDSGGPALLLRNGVETIVGITSFGDQGCVQGGYDTRVDSYAAWIDGFVQANDPQFVGTPDPGTDAPDLGAAPHDLGSGGRDPGGRLDLSTGRTSPDLAGAAIPAGQVGADCRAHGDCTSKVCAFEGDGQGYCTARCDPTAGDTCPNGLWCGFIDGAGYCVRPAANGATARALTGCSLSAPAATPPSTGCAALLLALAALSLHLRLRHRGTRP